MIHVSCFIVDVLYVISCVIMYCMSCHVMFMLHISYRQDTLDRIISLFRHEPSSRRSFRSYPLSHGPSPSLLRDTTTRVSLNQSQSHIQLLVALVLQLIQAVG